MVSASSLIYFNFCFYFSKGLFIEMQDFPNSLLFCANHSPQDMLNKAAFLENAVKSCIQ